MTNFTKYNLDGLTDAQVSESRGYLIKRKTITKFRVLNLRSQIKQIQHKIACVDFLNVLFAEKLFCDTVAIDSR